MLLVCGSGMWIRDVAGPWLVAVEALQQAITDEASINQRGSLQLERLYAAVMGMR